VRSTSPSYATAQQHVTRQRPAKDERPVETTSSGPQSPASAATHAARRTTRRATSPAPFDLTGLGARQTTRRADRVVAADRTASPYVIRDVPAGRPAGEALD